ncbi:molecular chaperone DnaJ [Marinomonas piezotolerans]|uniref:Molecular chaperone DnaJ n=1 Tax=Marinomonas piezotolerans TaxID=2213058 RepID=A0A370UC87_9GAMM|nr:DNA-J related domain-containing protein [Marinomonas piezotolerans]RDL45413.1 molecular chaperone DnaJ [Marinomonas piezotolerans]
MRNPLIPNILALLREHPEGLSEFTLLKSLQTKVTALNQLAEDPNLLLFRQHFLIMNALYQLQSSLWQEEHLSLAISATHIKILHADQVQQSDSTTLADSVDAKLAAYYLNWDEYIKTDTAEVERLLNSFYQGTMTNDQRKDALKVLDLDESFLDDKESIKRQYRKLAHAAHPDRGGKTDDFILLRQAYECLIA